MSDLLTEVFNYWQARFNVLSEAWRTGNNDAVLKATHDFIRSNDDAPAHAKLATIAELQAEIERLKRAANVGTGSAIEMASLNTRLENEISTLRESLSEANRLLSLNVSEVFRLKACEEDAKRYRFMRDRQRDICTYRARFVNVPNSKFDSMVDDAIATEHAAHEECKSDEAVLAELQCKCKHLIADLQSRCKHLTDRGKHLSYLCDERGKLFYQIVNERDNLSTYSAGLRELLRRASDELRSIRSKDCDVVYDTTLQTDIGVALQPRPVPDESYTAKSSAKESFEAYLLKVLRDSKLEIEGESSTSNDIIKTVVDCLIDSLKAERDKMKAERDKMKSCATSMAAVLRSMVEVYDTECSRVVDVGTQCRLRAMRVLDSFAAANSEFQPIDEDGRPIAGSVSLDNSVDYTAPKDNQNFSAGC